MSCRDSDKDKWHHCFCYLWAAGDSAVNTMTRIHSQGLCSCKKLGDRGRRREKEVEDVK